jgi:PKD domain
LRKTGQISALILATALAWISSCRDAPRDNLFDPETEILLVSVLSPADSSVYFSGEAIEFQVIAHTGYEDLEAGSSYLWKSSISGTLSNLRDFSVDSLPTGTHRITVIVEDSLLGGGSTSFTLTVKEVDELEVRITSPPGDTVFLVGGYIVPVADEYVPEEVVVAGRAWYFGENSGIDDVTISNPDTVVWNNTGTFNLVYQLVDSYGRAASDTVAVEVLATSEPPVAIIISPSTDTTIVLGASIFLEALEFKSSAEIAERVWEYPENSGLETLHDSVLAPGWRTISTEGDFEIVFRVTDFWGAVGRDTVTVTVIDTVTPPQPPTANISEPGSDSTIAQGNAIEFSATDSDSDGWIVDREWLWDDNSGIAADLATDTTASPGSRTFLQVGTFIIRYIVTDNTGMTTRDSVSITVEANQLPTATITSPSADTTVAAGDSILLDADGDDPDGSSITTQWSYRVNNGDLNVLFSFVEPGYFNLAGMDGTVRVYYSVTDNDGASISDSVKVTVVPNELPTAWIISPGKDTVVQWSTVSFLGDDSDSDGEVISRAWSNTYITSIDPDVDTTKAIGPKLMNVSGVHRINYTVTDNSGGTGSTFRIITVNPNFHPEASIFSPDKDVTISVGSSVSFAATDNDPDGTIVSRVWDYDDSGIPPDLSAIPGNRTFNKQGTFKIIYTVTDNMNISWSDSVTVTVGAL